jgi:D-beta-D-heptose 7-phosphate kinase/D-beta-D-heptose 1-phosphate adenosyltransferase
MSKLISLNNLIKILNTKYHILNTILVTGCFDILHPAHKEFLTAAKKQGDILLVGLESDERVRELKGNGRPINSLQARAKNLAAVGEINYIFPLPKKFHHQGDYLNLLQAIKPKFLAISEHDKYFQEKKKLIDQAGGKLYIFPYNKQYSSTNIIKQLNP